MIKSREEYKRYLRADGVYEKRGLRNILFNDIRRFMILLRKAEYYSNCKKPVGGNLIAKYFKFRLYRFGRKMGFTIPINTVGPGFSISHHGTITISEQAQIGSNCRIHVCVNIGATGPPLGVPKIRDNVYIGPGAKVFGGIEIADNIAIGANAVVNKSFLEKGISIGGVPAKKIGDGGAEAAGWSPENRTEK